MNNKCLIFDYLRHLSSNRGAMAALRCLLKSEQRFMGWPLLSHIGGIGNKAVETVAGLYALHPLESTDSNYNFGDACRHLAINRKTSNVSEESPFDRRFRRLLSCDTRDELCLHLIDVVRGLKSANVPVNFESLFDDIHWWGDVVRERWAVHYWSSRREEKSENVSD